MNSFSLRQKISAFAIFMAGAAALAPFTACSSGSETANGTGSNAGETEIASTIVVTSPNGAPLARAAARIWSMNENAIEVEISDTLDQNGQLKFATNLSGQHLLESHSGDSLSVMRWVDFGKQPSQTLAAAASVSLKGHILNNGAAVEGANVSILDKKATTNANGEFSFTGIPEGVHYAYVEGFFGRFTYQMQTGLDSTETTNNIDIADSIFTVIEDFENWRSRRTLIGRSFGQGWWFICTDSLQGGGSHMTPQHIESDEILVTGEAAKTGSSFHIVFDLNEDYNGHYGVAGFTIANDYYMAKSGTYEGYGLFDLRAATAISFDAKGKGELFLQVVKRGPDIEGNPAPGDSGFVDEREYHHTEGILLNDEWTHYTLTADDFGTELYEVNSINFLAEEDAEFFLDNIRLDGISPAMWPSLGKDF